MLVPFRPRPHGRERHHVSKVEGGGPAVDGHWRNMPRKAPKPRINGVHGLADAGKIATLDGFLDQRSFRWRRRRLRPKP